MAIYHLSLGFKGQPLPIEKVQEVLASAGWARYAPNSWIVDTNEEPKVIVEKLRSLMNTEDSIFMVEVNLKNNYGYLIDSTWKWVNSRT